MFDKSLTQQQVVTSPIKTRRGEGTEGRSTRALHCSVFLPSKEPSTAFSCVHLAPRL